MTTTHTVDALFAGKESGVRRIYDRLLTEARTVGPFEEDPKKTSIHLARGTAFAGIATRKAYLLLTLRTTSRIDSPRVVQTEQVSKSRWHNVVKIASEAEVDAELRGWLQSAYTLSAAKE